MAKFNISQNSFSIGEMGPTLKGRSDLKEYGQGLETLENMITTKVGGVQKRPGFLFEEDIDVLSLVGSQTAIIPFNPNDSLGYYIMIEYTSSTVEMAARKVDGTVCTISTSAIAPYVIQTATSILDPLGWRFVQSTDILFATHVSGDIEPLIIVRTADTVFSAYVYPNPASFITGQEPYYTIPFKDSNLTSTTLAYSGGTITSSVAQFFSGSVNQHISINDGSVDQMFRVTAYLTPTTVSVYSISSSIATIGATTVWAMGAWGGDAGYPSNVVIHDQRICWMGTTGADTSTYGSNEEPNGIWVGAVGNLFKMTRDTHTSSSFDSSDAFNFRIGGNKPNLITWCASGSNLKVGTSGEEYIINFLSLDDASISYPEVKQQTSHGGKAIQAVNVGYSTFFVSKTGIDVRQFKYNDSNGSFISTNFNLLANHLFTNSTYGSIRKMVWMESTGTLYVLSTTSVGGIQSYIYSMTFDTDSSVLSWSRHPLGTNLTIRDIAVVMNDTEEELIAVGTIDTTSDVVLKLGKQFTLDSLILDDYSLASFSDRPTYLDVMILSQQAVATTTHTGFDKLALKEVTIIADGVKSTQFITSGTIELDTAAYEVIAGIPYTAKLKTMPIDAGGTLGDSVATVKRIDEASIRFYKTANCTFGDHYTDSVGEMESIEFDNTGTLYSGLKSVLMPNGYETNGDYSIVIEQNEPEPLNILAITYKGQSGK